MKTLYLIFALSFLIDLAKCQNRLRISFDEFAIKYKVPDVFEKMDCNLFQSNNRSFVNAEMILKREIADLNVRALMEFWKPNSQTKLKLYDVRLDACRLLQTFNKNKLFYFYVKSFKKHSNVILSCPFKANFTYKMNDWYLDEEELPPFAPVGKFRTVTEYFIQQRLIIRVVTQGGIS
ncbi:uncharacterized protein LOC6541400 [Drosophila erecta]|uniref:Uncharacterized protein n=1 Tax=Drosophila erecta TaxID=7220 RepID=B3NAV2_DROER|nr:uncharacterized protein LOC6541400 [Drosophila erecta]EDV58666.1 uncharacterized protein Dere_GG23860 [Drosophila erecta]